MHTHRYCRSRQRLNWRLSWPAILVALALVGCGDDTTLTTEALASSDSVTLDATADTTSEPADTADAADSDADVSDSSDPEDVTPPQDIPDTEDAPEPEADVPDAPDVEDPPIDYIELFAPDQLGVFGSVASRPFSLPMSISTAGYGQVPGDEKTFSPYSNNFFSTRVQYDAPGVHVLALFRGEDRLALVTTDLIAIRDTLAEEVNQRLLARTGTDLQHQVILASNHTHAGPARWIPHPIAGIVADTFSPIIMGKLADDIADTIIEAFTHGEKVRVGHGFGFNSKLHNDRRCENPDLKDSTMGLLLVERETDGSPLAVAINFAIHGTVFGPSDLHYSGDAPGLIEQKVAEHFETPVEVLFFQSWAGDMSPGNPKNDFAVPASVSMRDEWVRMEALGMSAAQTVIQTLPQIPTVDDLELDSFVHRVPMNHKAIGYFPGEFDFFEGAAFCGGDTSECSNGITPNMSACVPLPQEYAISGLRMGAARIGELLLFTLPGEPVTQYTLNTMERIRQETGADDIWPVSYALDHLGYLLEVDDWMAGGYEPFFTFWGPKQGPYIAEMAVATVRRMLGLKTEIPFEDTVGPVLSVPAVEEAFEPEVSVLPGTVTEHPVDPGFTSKATFEFRGGDPWVDAPLVVVEEQDLDGNWSAVKKFNQVDLNSRSYELALEFSTEPPYDVDNTRLDQRSFFWRTTLFAERIIPSTTGDLRDKVLRFRANGKALAESGEVVDYEAISDSFEF